MSVQPEYIAQKFMGCYLRRIQSGRIRQKKTPLNREWRGLFWREISFRKDLFRPGRDFPEFCNI